MKAKAKARHVLWEWLRRRARFEMAARAAKRDWLLL